MDQAPHDLTRITAELESAAGAKKCHACGCFREALAQLRSAQLPEDAQRELLPVLERGEAVLQPKRYDCLGCEVCWPANALNLAGEAFPELVTTAACPADVPQRRAAWPPYSGTYRVLDSGGDVAVCVLTSEPLMERVAAAAPPRVALVGALYTENLGIERVIANVLSSPNLTTLVLCGADSRQRIGHLPGQSLLALVAGGLDERGRIAGALGRRPVIKNVSTEMVTEFREQIAVVDRIGEEDAAVLLSEIAALPVRAARRSTAASGQAPERIVTGPVGPLVLDPKGYFVVFPDRGRDRIVLEHYENGGTLSQVLEGSQASELWTAVIARGLLSRLDHAAYLGKELALAEVALRTGAVYVQDRAPEPSCGSDCGCHVSAKEA